MLKGVYKYVDIDTDEIIYIGKSEKSIEKRIESHKKENKFQNIIADIYYIELNTNQDIRLAEIYLINKYKPRLNEADKYEEKSILHLDLEEQWKYYDTHNTINCSTNDVNNDNVDNSLDNRIEYILPIDSESAIIEKTDNNEDGYIELNNTAIFQLLENYDFESIHLHLLFKIINAMDFVLIDSLNNIINNTKQPTIYNMAFNMKKIQNFCINNGVSDASFYKHIKVLLKYNVLYYDETKIFLLLNPNLIKISM